MDDFSVSELGMATAQLSMAAYFQLNSSFLHKSSLQQQQSEASSPNFPDNFYSTTESSFSVAPVSALNNGNAVRRRTEDEGVERIFK